MHSVNGPLHSKSSSYIPVVGGIYEILLFGSPGLAGNVIEAQSHDEGSGGRCVTGV